MKQERKKTDRKDYDRSFKENAVRLSYERSNITALARELGIGSNLLFRWRKESEQFKEASFQGKGNARLTEEQKEIHRLRKELSNRELEIEILKKAMGIISKSDR
jgi:transposase